MEAQREGGSGMVVVFKITWVSVPSTLNCRQTSSLWTKSFVRVAFRKFLVAGLMEDDSFAAYWESLTDWLFYQDCALGLFQVLESSEARVQFRQRSSLDMITLQETGLLVSSSYGATGCAIVCFLASQLFIILEMIMDFMKMDLTLAQASSSPEPKLACFPT